MALNLLKRLGLRKTAQEPGVLVLALGQPALAIAREVAISFKYAGVRAGVTICALDGSGDVAPPLPGLAALFLSAQKTRALLVIGDPAAAPARLFAACEARATPVAWINTGREQSAPPGAVSFDGSRLDLDGLRLVLLEMVGRDRKWVGRNDFSLPRRIAAKMRSAMDRSPRPRWITLLGRRHDSAASLRERLGAPGTILCLGNGPSSEDPALAAINHDALFRANHAWLERPMYRAPHVVFTGLKATMRKVHGAIFGIYGESTEMVLLMGRLLAPWRKAEYFVADHIANPCPDFVWGGHRPTSGAVMIATAVALKPQLIVIAGIDLFQNPAGTYPGAAGAANAYTPAHDRDKEIAFLCACLERHAGGLQVFGDGLRAELRKRRILKD